MKIGDKLIGLLFDEIVFRLIDAGGLLWEIVCVLDV